MSFHFSLLCKGSAFSLGGQEMRWFLLFALNAVSTGVLAYLNPFNVQRYKEICKYARKIALNSDFSISRKACTNTFKADIDTSIHIVKAA